MNPKELIGKWVNEYGSEMQIKKITDNTFTGTYSSTTGETGHYNVIGCFNPVLNTNIGSLTTMIGISWNSIDKGATNNTIWDQSISSMTGQVQRVGDKYIFPVTHVLVNPTLKSNNWESSYIDKLTFVKQPS
jgi:hypothetical protein